MNEFVTKRLTDTIDALLKEKAALQSELRRVVKGAGDATAIAEARDEALAEVRRRIAIHEGMAKELHAAWGKLDELREELNMTKATEKEALRIAREMRDAMNKAARDKQAMLTVAQTMVEAMETESNRRRDELAALEQHHRHGLVIQIAKRGGR